jgi:predicted Zn-dependent protease
LEELKTIVRHELGHGFGLAHSSAPEDLMYAEIKTEYPYISECDISAIEKLYNNLQESRVICEI